MGTGCGICSHKVFRQGVNDLLTTNPEIAKEWDYRKNIVKPNEVMAGSNKKKYWFICPQNGDLSPDMVLPNSHKIVWWICKEGHEWEARISNRSNGTGCPFCKKRS